MSSAGKGSTLEQSLARNPSGHWPPDLTIRSRGSNATTQRPRVEAGPADRSRGAAFSRKQLQPKYCRITDKNEGSYRFSSTEAAFKILQ